MKRVSPGSLSLTESNGKCVAGKFFQLWGIFSDVAGFTPPLPAKCKSEPFNEHGGNEPGNAV